MLLDRYLLPRFGPLRWPSGRRIGRWSCLALWRAADRGDGPLQWWPVAHGKLPYEDLASGDPGHWLGRAAHLRLRHMAVALWIAAGAGPKEVATRAGHSSVSFTLDRYGHLYPEADRALRDRLNRFHEAAGDAE